MSSVNPHIHLQKTCHPYPTGPCDGHHIPLWRCVHCGAIGTLAELDATECAHVHPPCRWCGQSPLCAEECVGMAMLVESASAFTAQPRAWADGAVTMPINTEDLLAERDMLQERVYQLEAVLRCIADDVEVSKRFCANRGGQQAGVGVLHGCRPSTLAYLDRLLRQAGIGTK